MSISEPKEIFSFVSNKYAVLDNTSKNLGFKLILSIPSILADNADPETVPEVVGLSIIFITLPVTLPVPEIIRLKLLKLFAVPVNPV